MIGTIQINIDRLNKDLDKYARFGEDPEGGITRPSFSEPDLGVRKLFIKELRYLGLEVSIDGAGNIWGSLKGSGKKSGSIVIGSHLDTVPNGGKYDGALGTLMAKEIIRTIIDNKISLDHDVDIVSFTAEESNDFNISTFGSRSFAGRLSPGFIKGVSDSNGLRLADALKSVDGGIDRYASMNYLRKDKKAFIELHIEQGKRLEDKNISAAVVDNMVGIYRNTVTVTGEANHSGTTMMADRNDALTAAAEIILAIERLGNADPTDLVATVGRLSVAPNAVNIVPGKVEFTFEIRGETESSVQKMIESIQDYCEEVSEKRRVTIDQEVIQDQKPVAMDAGIVHILQKTAEELSEPYLTVTSMARHDAGYMTEVCKSAMLFVKSIDGKSHCPEEYSTLDDIEKAGNVMLQGILNVDRELD
ncbi:N-carbamoyl-L-amino-acid hydrolase [Scopulibacillus darangshiensis]|uniref:N-carbamoyl-L-amino-acid hydrolase n=1 Tax=Scopulibacillus darangshiensis TaxID=442528 RepID=A0A4R2P6L9_9BACL|nr:Zn-dependent hydrolase [Scopulibacillus darangshiensis]TCP29445.1 N-carbamoyl-L-amino-acid hydrolase [Scopulibacillus darangshiensis]